MIWNLLLYDSGLDSDFKKFIFFRWVGMHRRKTLPLYFLDMRNTIIGIK